MKKLIYILLFSFSLHAAVAQEEQPGAGKLRERMVEYIQNKLALDKAEAEKFQPVFFDYIRDLHKTKKEFKADRLVLQQKVIELRLRYREQFKPIVGEKRSNDVFQHENEFIRKAQDVLDERRQQRRTNNEKNSKLFSN